jgi:hypothetical protein
MPRAADGIRRSLWEVTSPFLVGPTSDNSSLMPTLRITRLATLEAIVEEILT